MTRPEIELIAEEIVEAINQGRFNEASRKISHLDCDDYYEVSALIEPKVSRYDYQRLANMLIEYREE